MSILHAKGTNVWHFKHYEMNTLVVCFLDDWQRDCANLFCIFIRVSNSVRVCSTGRICKL